MLTCVSTHMRLQRLFSGENPLANFAPNIAISVRCVVDEFADGISSRSSPTSVTTRRFRRTTAARRTELNFVGLFAPVPWVQTHISERGACWSCLLVSCDDFYPLGWGEVRDLWHFCCVSPRFRRSPLLLSYTVFPSKNQNKLWRVITELWVNRLIVTFLWKKYHWLGY